MQYEEQKIVIIGFGHLMEYLKPCYQEFLGQNLVENLVATTADVKNYEKKKAEQEFPILLNDNLTALETKPDIILFAPPPQAVPQLMEDTLKPYFAKCREEGDILPDLYVFPPAPAGKFYLDNLGYDVRVVSILPNMTREIAGRNVAKEGYTILTFPEESKWEEEKKQKLARMFSPLGQTLEIGPEHNIPVLASSVACNVFIDVVLSLEGIFERFEWIRYSEIAEAMRAVLYEAYDLRMPGVLPCGYGDISQDFLQVIRITEQSWYRGLLEFLEKYGMSGKETERFLAQRLDSFLQMCQLMTKAQIREMREKRATPGGSLDRGLKAFEEHRNVLKEKLESIVREICRKERGGRPFKASAEVRSDLAEIAGTIAEAVCSHSMHMDKAKASEEEKKMEFGIDHHATLFALLSKEIQEACGEAGKDAIGQATLHYGMERGQRMARQAQADGAPLTLEHYFAYVEWTDEKNEMKRGIAQKTPFYRTAVYQCGWVESWKKRGLLEYGRVYCQYADYGLVAGFNPDNVLKLDKTLSNGSDVCDFVWEGYELNEEREAVLKAARERVGLKYRKDFLYHTAHLYQCVTREFVERFGDTGKMAAEEALKEFAEIFSEEAADLVAEYPAV